MSKVKVGDKIKLKKEMGPLTDIGTICTVKEIDSHGNIIFSNKNLPGTLGYMTEDELEKYFTIEVNESKDTKFICNEYDLNNITQGVAQSLRDLGQIKSMIAQKVITTLPVRKLEVGDVFTYLSRKYVVLRKFYTDSKVAVCPLNCIDDIIHSMVLFNMDELVENKL